MEVSAFMTEQLKEQLMEQRDHDEKLRQEAKVERLELEAKLKQQRTEANSKLEQQQAQATAKMEQQQAQAKAEMDQPREAAPVVALQARLEALHAAKLLSDEELYAVWDAIADSEEAAEDDRVPRLISLSGKMASDRAFARQLQRKKWL